MYPQMLPPKGYKLFSQGLNPLRTCHEQNILAKQNAEMNNLDFGGRRKGKNCEDEQKGQQGEREKDQEKRGEFVIEDQEERYKFGCYNFPILPS